MLNEKILLERAGNFTASENHRLMAGWDRPTPDRNYPEFNELYRYMHKLDKAPLIGEAKKNVHCDVNGELIRRTWAIIKDETPPAGLVTYAQEKANEGFYEPDPSLNFSTAHTRNGEEREEECMRLLSDATGLNFEHIGDDQIHVHANEIGCTPDGIVRDNLDLIETGGEAKCKSPLEHTKLLMINSNEDMLREAFDHYVQIQTCMLVTGAKKWYFACFNPYAIKALRFKHIIITRDNFFIKVLNNRIEIAKKIKAEFYQKIEREVINSQQIKKAA